MAQLRRDHSGRFGHFAALPLPDIEGRLAEIDHAFGTLKADGIGLLTSYDNKWPGDPAFAPVIRWIISHGGAAIPPLAHRIAANIASRKELAERIPDALAELQRLCYDTALAANPVATGELLKLVTPGQVLFNTDFPFDRTPQTIEGMRALGLSAADVRDIEYGNASSLLPRWRRPLAA